METEFSVTDAPAIGIFAGDPAQRHYLETLAGHAGLSLVPSGTDGQAAIVIVAPDMALPAEPFIDGQVFLSLGARTQTGEHVRVLPLPAKAALLLGAIKRLLSERQAGPLQIGICDAVLDLQESLWIEDGKEPVRLTEKEVSILTTLKQAAPQSISRQFLLDKVWSYVEGVETHTLETHIYRLRQKIEADPSRPEILLTTEEGYRIAG